MPSMTITIERTPLTLRVDGREVQVEKLGIRLPFGRKPTDLTDIAAKAEFEFLYDKPYPDPKKVRVAGQAHERWNRGAAIRARRMTASLPATPLA